MTASQNDAIRTALPLMRQFRDRLAEGDPVTARTWVLIVPMRPTLTNAVHNMHFRKASADRKKWRAMGHRLAELANVPPLTAIEVTCWGVYPSGRLPDPDACAPSLKGVLDGIVDFGVIPDDTGTHVKAITYLPAVKEPGVDASLHVLIEEVT